MANKWVKFPFPVFSEEEHGVEYKYQIIKKRKCIVFKNKEDFNTYFMARDGAVPKLVSQWHLCEENDWVEANDGGIVEVLKKGPLNHPQNTPNYKYHDAYIRTTVGTFIICLRDPSKFKMDTDFSLHENRYSFSGKGYYSIEDQIANRKKLSVNERIFAYNVAHGMDVVEAYQKCYYNKPEMQPRIIKKRALLLASQERIKKQVTEEVKDIAEKLGIDHKYILENIKDIAETSFEREDFKTSLESYKVLGKAIGTTEPETKRTQGGVVGFIQSFGQHSLEEPESVRQIKQSIADEGKVEDETI